MSYSYREIDGDDELLTVLETLGDTPTLGIYDDEGELIAVGLRYASSDTDIPKIVKKLNS